MTIFKFHLVPAPAFAEKLPDGLPPKVTRMSIFPSGDHAGTVQGCLSLFRTTYKIPDNVDMHTFTTSSDGQVGWATNPLIDMITYVASGQDPSQIFDSAWKTDASGTHELSVFCQPLLWCAAGGSAPTAPGTQTTARKGRDKVKVSSYTGRLHVHLIAISAIW